MLPSNLTRASAPQNCWTGSNSSGISVQSVTQMRNYMALFPTHFLFYLRPSYTFRIGKPFRTQVVYLFSPLTKIHLIEGKCVYPGQGVTIIIYVLSVLRNSKRASYTTTITTYIQHERGREKNWKGLLCVFQITVVLKTKTTIRVLSV